MRLFLPLVTAIALLGSLLAQPAPDPGGLLQAQSSAGQLAAELQYLQTSLGTGRAPGGRELAARAREVAQQANLIYRELGSQSRREDVARDFQNFERGLQQFTDELRQRLPQNVEALRAAGRAEYAAHQVAGALLPNRPAPDQRRGYLVQLARSVERQARLLEQMAADLPPNVRGERFENDVRGLATAGDRLHKAIESGAPDEQVGREFNALTEWWQAISADLGRMQLARYPAVRAQAARLERTYASLAGQFGAQVRPGIDFFNSGPQPVIAFGAGEGGGPHVKVFQDLRGQESQSFYAYDPRFLGGVRVAVGDVNGDGVPDVVTAPGPGSPPLVRVYSGRDQSLLGQFMAYDQPYDRGVYVAVADLNKDGRANIVTGTDVGAPPHVKIFQGLNGRVAQSFYAYDKQFLGGVRVAIGDINGDGFPDIVTAPGPGIPAVVQIFSGKDWQRIGAFAAYPENFTKGAFVAVADMPNEGRDYIVTGADAGGGPHVRVLRGVHGKEVHSFYAYDQAFPGGVRVAARDVDGDGIPDIITAPGFGMPAIVRVFSGKDAQPMYEFDAYPTSRAGAYVAAH